MAWRYRPVGTQLIPAPRRRVLGTALSVACLMAPTLAACSDGGAGTTTVTTGPATTATSSSSTTTGPAGTPPDLLIDAGPDRDPPEAIFRSRLVKVDLGLLLDGRGRPTEIGEITVNLFPDTAYTGVITEVERRGDAVTWRGYLRGVEASYLTMIYTASVFIGHFAGPPGVYEVDLVGDDVYRVVQVDQGSLPTEARTAGDEGEQP